MYLKRMQIKYRKGQLVTDLSHSLSYIAIIDHQISITIIIAAIADDNDLDAFLSTQKLI